MIQNVADDVKNERVVTKTSFCRQPATWSWKQNQLALCMCELKGLGLEIA